MRKRNFVMPGRKADPIWPNRTTDLGPWGRELLPREQLELAEYRPLADWHRVELLPKVEQTSGGIWLPDTYRMNWTDARILASGPGEPLADGLRGQMWVDPGDRVLFMKHDLKNHDERLRQGMVRDEDLIAVQRTTSETPDVPEPLNDWCLIEPLPPETHASEHIIWSEEDRPRPMRGRLLDWGPGRRRAKGPLAGIRKPVHELWGLDEERAENLIRNATVYWSRNCPALAIGRRELEYLLIQADDLLGYGHRTDA